MSSELGSIQTAAVAPVGDGFRPLPAILSGGGSAGTTVGSSGSAPQNETAGRKPAREEVAEAVEELSQHVTKSRAELRFQIDEDLDRVVVSIVDGESGEVLLQIPGEEVLRLAKLMARRGDSSLISAVA
ncbi:MAG TPA: flagellar protein FlaG [Nevskiaceae bacterium]|nr:flagellar protein FlaG [Nevskiaceae bacterium]